MRPQLQTARQPKRRSILPCGHNSRLSMQKTSHAPQLIRSGRSFNAKNWLSRSFPTTTYRLLPARPRRYASTGPHINRGHETTEQYEEFLRASIEDCIRQQEKIGLDVLVHGEFERNDMVEYFAEFLEGFTFTENGWVQGYGSRCVKPP